MFEIKKGRRNASLFYFLLAKKNKCGIKDNISRVALEKSGATTK